jgi:putative MATE family efflux protein
MVLEMLMESLFAVVDVFWVSRLGSDAIAVVGLTESVMSLIYAIAVGISIAATAIVARRIGEGSAESAAQAAAQVVLLGLAVSAALGIALAFFSTEILELMGATPSLIETGANFARVMFGGNVTVVMIFLINAIFRGAGDAVLAMRTLWLANLLNIALSPCFIFGLGPFPELGVVGAAVATNVGRGAGVIYQLWHLTSRHSRIRLQVSHFRPAPEVMHRILVTSANGTAQLLIATTSWIGLVRVLALFGSAAVAGYTIALRLITFVMLPAWGLASASATLVGQNLGARQPDRAEAAVRISTRGNVMLLAVVGVAFILSSDTLARLFTTDSEVHGYAVQALRAMSLAFPFYAVGMSMAAAFNGAGDTWTPTRVSFFCLWLGEVPLAWLLAKHLGFGPLGVFIALPTAVSVLALWSFVLFTRGRWKLLRA